MSTSKSPEQTTTKSPSTAVDGEVSSVDLAALHASIDPRAERSLVWKFDLRILPVLAIMYLFNSLDKSNLGNAKTAGIEGMCCVCNAISRG